MIISRSRR
ncbi:hypothetical protein N7530_006903 [Penicillium desertorum]|uniref:Uncharacterized protein n=1 Tax=Penicillium desertorum TaxID=1303715 RepID=A0A9W9WSL1_9EURO|nr:hypothetical protein N7530_006903 [Penicillium desertorum]